MKLPTISAPLLIAQVVGLFHYKQQPLTYTPMPPLHEDLGGLNRTEIEQELSVIDRRIELNIIQPEGKDGLSYRRSRLQAQLRAVKKREE